MPSQVQTAGVSDLGSGLCRPGARCVTSRHCVLCWAVGQCVRHCPPRRHSRSSRLIWGRAAQVDPPCTGSSGASAKNSSTVSPAAVATARPARKRDREEGRYEARRPAASSPRRIWRSSTMRRCTSCSTPLQALAARCCVAGSSTPAAAPPSFSAPRYRASLGQQRGDRFRGRRIREPQISVP